MLHNQSEGMFRDWDRSSRLSLHMEPCTPRTDRGSARLSHAYPRQPEGMRAGRFFARRATGSRNRASLVCNWKPIGLHHTDCLLEVPFLMHDQNPEAIV